MRDPKQKTHRVPRLLLAAVAAVVGLTAFVAQQREPTIYIIGDSTVNYGHGPGSDTHVGWGDLLAEHFDTTRVHVENDARAGRSSRTFQTEGLWDRVLAKLKPGDFVLMQFGHNDGIAPDDPQRPRGSLRGTGEETIDIVNPVTHQPETVYTYGHYMRKYATDAKARGATPIILSPIPRNVWNHGKVVRNDRDYGLWAKQAAKETGAKFIDLNAIVADQYDALGPTKVGADFFVTDHTHTSRAGAKLNAAAVARGIRALGADFPLNSYLKGSGRSELRPLPRSAPHPSPRPLAGEGGASQRAG
ncbi:MAG TPA: rhamnogalacturonan acetylesterase [Longimicrobiaceae bacterium]|nr:rhamnogalacturonan acetylesterase [Longimicrobiaceae bacterium]